jgi:hypothetical protein
LRPQINLTMIPTTALPGFSAALGEAVRDAATFRRAIKFD